MNRRGCSRGKPYRDVEGCLLMRRGAAARRPCAARPQPMRMETDIMSQGLVSSRLARLGLSTILSRLAAADVGRRRARLHLHAAAREGRRLRLRPHARIRARPEIAAHRRSAQHHLHRHRPAGRGRAGRHDLEEPSTPRPAPMRSACRSSSTASTRRGSPAGCSISPATPISRSFRPARRSSRSPRSSCSPTSSPISPPSMR